MPWKPEFLSNLDQNLLKPFPYPKDASDKMSFQSAYWLQRYSCLKVLTDGHTDARTYGRRLDFGPGELKLVSRIQAWFVKYSCSLSLGYLRTTTIYVPFLIIFSTVNKNRGNCIRNAHTRGRSTSQAYTFCEERQ